MRTLRCAIYTRKSTEHGLELEFNSLDAQHEACDAYIRSQASQGWQPVGQRYEDAAFSGGNLERPSLQRLLTDIDLGKVDAVVVYKIDRLTRSLADFAKLVEVFDAKSVSFVAVTQQFNTTTSMGRLTLNVLLSFAQFERELSSERVRDKIAASRAKGKWTGGSVPLGYDVENKKLVPNTVEMNAIRQIFEGYERCGSLPKLVTELDAKGVVTKVRSKADGTTAGGIPFAYGSLANLLRNRVYVGEVSHRDKWYVGEHTAIVDRELFDRVQATMSSNAIERKKRSLSSPALLAGLVFDDRGNNMRSTYTAKKGARYQFYVSVTTLQGRRQNSGSVSRVSAPDVEKAVLSAIRSGETAACDDTALIAEYVQRIEVCKDRLTVSLKPLVGSKQPKPISVSFDVGNKRPLARIERETSVGQPDPKLVTAVARAHYWLRILKSGEYDSIESLAKHDKVHAKVLRLHLRLCFLAPAVTEAVLEGRHKPGLRIGALQKIAQIHWEDQINAVVVRAISA